MVQSMINIIKNTLKINPLLGYKNIYIYFNIYWNLMASANYNNFSMKLLAKLQI